MDRYIRKKVSHFQLFCMVNNSLTWFYSGEEETANLLLSKFKWGHAFMSLNRYALTSLYYFVIFTSESEFYEEHAS